MHGLFVSHSLIFDDLEVALSFTFVVDF